MRQLKAYAAPDANVVLFDSEDIVTASGTAVPNWYATMTCPNCGKEIMDDMANPGVYFCSPKFAISCGWSDTYIP